MIVFYTYNDGKKTALTKTMYFLEQLYTHLEQILHSTKGFFPKSNICN